MVLHAYGELYLSLQTPLMHRNCSGCREVPAAFARRLRLKAQFRDLSETSPTKGNIRTNWRKRTFVNVKDGRALEPGQCYHCDGSSE